MFNMTSAGINAFDLHTAARAYVGTICQTAKGDWKVFFNMTATKGSQRRFPSADAAMTFIRDRRVSKGWGV